MGSPTEPPDGNWWNEPVNRRESIWLGLGAVWSLVMFSWMSGWVRLGDQNPTGDTYEVPTSEFRDRVSEFEENAVAVEEGYAPPSEEVYVGAFRYGWDGIRIDGEPLVLEAGTEYDLHLSTYDVQHALSIRPEDNLSQQMNLDMMPGYEWVVPMEFDDPGTYHVLCTEFCGNGHERMHASFEVVEEIDA